MVSLLPTKTLTIDGDTRLGQSGVPAIFHCDGKGLSQVPQHHSHLICMLQDSVPAGSLQ